MSGSDRLGRLLFIVPYVMHKDGVPVDELAQLLDVTPAQIHADVDLLCMVGQPPLTPEHLVDLYIEDGVVFAELDQNLSRPMRLTHEEARALVLGVKLVGDIGGLGQALQNALDLLTQKLNVADKQAVEALSQRIYVVNDGEGPQRHSAVLREGIETHRAVLAVYYSATSDRKKTYSLKPLALLVHGGVEYLVALDADADDKEKLFRLDRLQNAVLLGPSFEPPALDLERFRTPRLYFGGDAIAARLQLTSKAWARVSEHFNPHDVLIQDACGSQVTVQTDSVSWLARWTLSFGLEAMLLGPQEALEHTEALCHKAQAVYAQAPTPVAWVPPQT